MNTFKTILKSPECFLFKEKNSKFYGFAFPFESETDLKPLILDLKKLHPKAGHFCYAYQIGAEKLVFRTNDDGEPNNSAGSPILGQIQSFGLTNVLIVVIRYFGGTKLGVGGLISAYKNTAQAVLQSCKIVTKTIDVKFKIDFELKNINLVMRIIKENNLKMLSQKLDISSEIIIGCPKTLSNAISEKFKNIHKISIDVVD